MRLRERVWPGLRTRSIWLEFTLALLSTIAISAGGATGDRGPVSVAVFAVLTAATFVLILTTRRRAPLIPFLLSALVSVLSPAINGALIVLGYAVGRYDGRWPARIAAAATGVLVVAEPWSGGPAGEQVSRWLGGAVLVLFPGGIGVYVRTRAQLLAALRERAERAEAEQELLARDAVVTERTRIAREMHDAVGHRVSLMVLQAGAIEMAARDPERVEQLAGHVQTAGRQALDELRQMVGVLRAGETEDAPLAPQPGLSALRQLVEESREAGMDVDLGDVPVAPIAPATSRAAYRIVQEALTNAGKHAPGAHVEVTLHRSTDELAVRVVNGPGRAAAPVPGGGYGLVGLGERVRTLGGRLTAQPRLDGGFCVEAVLPA
ncbi:sensor histidine kinase [Blastococcus sp. URHD0036]|uniref:sensor histidine kinase n=1 Tax=Blastococcus sp. URHD0036 TaxID=1380356 RepID=UPI0004980607|nr:histidine kinase [Blastococcus sp. URHD0036]